MKYIILVLILFPVLCKAQNDIRTGLVTKRNGMPVFIMSEPVKEYNIVGAVTNKTNADSAGNNKNMPATINEMIDKLIAYAAELSKKNKIDFDAIITEDGLSGTLIKFKPGKSITDSVGHKP